jgi:hypothetical protein
MPQKGMLIQLMDEAMLTRLVLFAESQRTYG